MAGRPRLLRRLRTTAPAGRRGRTRCGSRAATARRRSSSDPRAPHGRAGLCSARSPQAGRRSRPAWCSSDGQSSTELVRWLQTQVASARPRRRRLLDAAERLLVERRLRGDHDPAASRPKPGVNHGLVHYYFGSVENLLVRVLERFTERLIARQRAMYADPELPFAEKWRTAMRYLDADREYQKVWLELQALAWNRPELRDASARVNARVARRPHRGVGRAAGALRDSRSRWTRSSRSSITFNEGIILERLSGRRGRPPRAAGLDRRLAGGGRGMTAVAGTASEQTRARYPDEEGYVERDGVRVFYEVYGQGEPTILLLPTWTIVHSRHWKLQIPYLARHFAGDHVRRRAATGRSDRPPSPEAYDERRVRGGRARGARRDRHRAGGNRRASRSARSGPAPARAEQPGARRRRRLHRGGAPARRPRRRPGGYLALRRGARDRRGLGEVQQPLLAPRLSKGSWSSSSRSASRSRTRRSRSRTASAGAWTQTPRHFWRARGAWASSRARRCWSSARGCAARCSSSTGTRTAIRPHAHGRRAGASVPAAGSSRSRAPATSRTPATRSRSTC